MYRLFLMSLVIIQLFILAACGQSISSGKLQKVGMLVPDTINDQVWATKGYEGLLKIQSKFQLDIFYKEGINSLEATKEVVEEFVQKDVNLIFGHGNEYAEYFNQISRDYPDVQFISFNGEAKRDNTTSLNFEAHAMGFFGGMVAGEMTKTLNIGVLAAYEWQPEVNGFFEGAAFQNDDVHVKINFVESWDDKEKALILLDDMIESGVDVVYPAGDGYNVPVIEKLREHGLYAIGFVSDQSDLGEGTVLSSTVQHVDVLYELVAERFNKGELESGNLYFDFQDGVISMGDYSSNVDEAFQSEIEAYIKHYSETGLLPNQTN
ncbi:BMP family ABC transporter substrate-binding protein [Bacillus sp. PS06]|uniref:BMP family ABC transporter substrate-binding protein n=1 Tax=Bacillus sp. PS06 TaxID=2764176 RepID=UPI00177AFE7C|nr:BMP family ABC transporter substrate-binding protein [Bacillus sp. PS06]MBD8067547.1 BMP family ABC transporter substrate-binding protein [Bacillus sp. PS06]